MAEHRFGESSNRAFRKIKNQGIQLAESPIFKMPVMPEDITVLQSEEVMVLLGQTTSWLDFIETQFYSAQVDEEFEKGTLEELEAHFRIIWKTEKTVTSQKAAIFAEKDFIDQRDKTHRAYAYRKLIETVYNRLDRQRFALSREITRRTGGS